MYRKHFGLARHHPFARDLAPEDLFASAAATELEVRLRTSSTSAASASSPASPGAARPPSAARLLPPSTPASTASSTCPSPPAT